MESRCVEWSARGNHQAVACAVELHPAANVGLVSGFLRSDVGIELLLYTLTVMSQECAVVAVLIVFDGSAAIIIYYVEFTGHCHIHAVSEQIGHFRGFRYTIGVHCLADDNGAFIVDGIGKGEFASLYGCQIIVGLYLHKSGGIDGGVESRKFQFRILPDCITVLKAGAHVVVGRRTPEARCKLCTRLNHRSALYIIHVHHA